MSERTKAQLLAENKRLRAEVERLDRIVNPPPPEPPEEPAPNPRLYVLALGELEKRIVPNAFQIPEAIDDARDVTFVWVKGHRDEANNNIVDRLSRAASKSHTENRTASTRAISDSRLKVQASPRLGQCSGMTPEDVRLVVAGGDEFSVVCRSLPHRDP